MAGEMTRVFDKAMTGGSCGVEVCCRWQMNKMCKLSWRIRNPRAIDGKMPKEV
jgi:hypothetical protein